jgi:hypothetical protein
MRDALNLAEASETTYADLADPEGSAPSDHYQRVLQVLRDIRHMLPPDGVDLVDRVLEEVTLEAEETGGPSLLGLLDYEQEPLTEGALLVTHEHIYGSWRGL